MLVVSIVNDTWGYRIEDIMTTLAETMLEVARVMCRMREGTATGGSVSALVDTSIIETGGTYTDGTLWMLTGDNADLCVVVNNHVEQTLAIPTQSTAIVAGDTYAVAHGAYKKHEIKQALLKRLRETEIATRNASQTLVVANEKASVTLSVGISNVRRVEVDGEPSYNWYEQNGVIRWNAHDPASSAAIVIWYMAPHADIAESVDIEDAISLNWLKWATVEDLLWQRYRQTEADDPTVARLIERANSMVRRYSSDKETERVMKRDPVHTGW